MKRITDKERLDFIQRYGENSDDSAVVCLNDAGWAVDHYSAPKKKLRQAIDAAIRAERNRN